MLLGGVVLFATSMPASAEDESPGGHDAHDDALHLTVFQDGAWWDVDIHLYVVEGTSDEELREAKAEVLARFPGAIERSDPEVGAAYTLVGPSWSQKKTTWYYNPVGKPASMAFDQAALSGATNTWNAAGGDFSFSYEGLTTKGTGACGITRDGQNTVGWANQGGQTLGITCGWSQTAQGKKTYTEFDMEIDPGWNWTDSTSSPQTDLQSVLLHEFGHALGLNHSQSNKCPGPSMCASYAPKAIVRALHKDDLDGLYAVYGQAAATPTATATATATATPTKTASPTPVGTVPRGQFKAIAGGVGRN